MIINRLIFFSFIFLIVFSACRKKRVKIISIHKKTEAQNVIRIRSENEHLISDDFLDLIEIIPLTSNDSSSPLVHIDKVIPVSNGYIVLDRKMGRVCKFDSYGKFIKDFFSIGRRFGEFTKVDDILKDIHTNNIIIYSNDDYKISWFSQDGNILKEKKVEFNARRINWLSSKYFVFTTNYGYTNNDLNYNCLLVDTMGNLVHKLMKRPKSKSSMSFSGLNTPSKQVEESLIAEPLSNIIYKLTYARDTLLVNSEYRIDFGGKSIADIENINIFFEKTIDSILSGKNYILADAFEYKDYLFFNLNYENKKRWAVFNKNDNLVYLNDNRIAHSFWSILRTVPSYLTKNNEFIAGVDYSVFYNFRRNYPEKFELFFDSYYLKSKRIKITYDYKKAEIDGSPFLFIYKINLPNNAKKHDKMHL